MNEHEFTEIIWQKGRELYRPMPWREDTQPYYILVSELMLQQTQVDRVISKFQAFITAFPSVIDLANAQLSEVLILWSGLGYNRRAKFLWQAAQKIAEEYKGNIPDSYEKLLELPGVGPNTAGALLAYAFNQPVVFIETNIRTVYFYHFFSEQVFVSDKELRQKLEATMDQEDPRQWYWALMDYGTYLKKSGAGQLNKSAHYKKQSALKGSHREMRGWIIKQLSQGSIKKKELEMLYAPDERFASAVRELTLEGLIKLEDYNYSLK